MLLKDYFALNSDFRWPSFLCRFAVDTMQSVCLDEFGGEKAVEPSSQETTLVQHIFGGRLQSQVMHHSILKLVDSAFMLTLLFSLPYYV